MYDFLDGLLQLMLILSSIQSLIVSKVSYLTFISKKVAVEQLMQIFIAILRLIMNVFQFIFRMGISV